MADMKGISIKSMAVATAVFGSMVAGNALAGSGCLHGSYGDVQANVPPIENADILADAETTPDPKWLAMKKRRELEGQAQSGVIVVPN